MDMINENLSIEVTTECNSSCSYCFARAGKTGDRSLSFDIVKDVLSEGYETGYRGLHITGGEPLLYEHLFEVIGLASKLGYESIFLNTNGTLLTENIAGILSEYRNILTLSISLQGDRVMHDYYRGSGTWETAVRGLENTCRAGLKNSVFTTVTRSLLPDIPGFAESLIREYPGIECLTLIQIIRVHNDFFDLSFDLLRPQDFIRLVLTCSFLNLYGIPVYILENPLANAAARLLGTDWSPEAPPLYRKGRLVVLSNGDVTLAHSSRDSFGKYSPGMIKRTLYSEEYKTAVAPDTRACPECGHYTKCRESGMLRPSEWFRGMDEEPPFCRRVLDRIYSMKKKPQYV